MLVDFFVVQKPANYSQTKLTLKVPSKICSRRHFSEQADDSHEMSRLVFSGKKIK